MYKVLIVEDEKLIRQGLKLTIDWDAYGCQLIGEAVNGEEGIEKILALHPDIVITDIKMPKKTGLEMMRALEDDFSGEYIILSGFDEFAYAKEAIGLGAVDYLLKPIDDNELEQAIGRAVKSINNKRRHFLSISGEDRSEEMKRRINSGYSDKYVGKACDIIRERYKEDLSAKSVAEELNISDSYLEKLFKSKTSYTFHSVLTFYRIKAAIELLENSDLKVYNIAYEVGYNDAKHFSKTFQKVAGMSPTEYRNGFHLSVSENT